MLESHFEGSINIGVAGVKDTNARGDVGVVKKKTPTKIVNPTLEEALNKVGI